MSRIDEALRLAGEKTAADQAAAGQDLPLDLFPVGPDAEPASGEPIAHEPRARVVEQEPLRREPARDSHGSADLLSETSRAEPIFFERLIVHQNAEPVAVEQYRRLAAVLHQSQVDRGNKIVMVASAQQAEGKTLTAANLALTLSESYRRKVLLIDADLRRPSLNRLFQLPPASGLSESLRAEREGPLHVLTLSPSLALLPGGAPDPDPMSGLTSGRMRAILEKAAETFDWVILDTPPVALLTDTHLLAAIVDSAVLVVDAGSTPCALVQRTIESIGRDKIVGVVLNRVEQSSLREASYYDYDRYLASGRRRSRFLGSERSRGRLSTGAGEAAV